MGSTCDEEEQREGSGVRRAAAGQRQGRAGRADRAADRRAGADHVGEHLRLGPAHVRGPDRLRARPLVRAREPGPGGRGRRRRRQGPGGRLGRPAVQHRLRTLQELRAPAHELLPDRPAGAEHGRRRVRLRRHGPVRRRAGRAAARALGRLQLPAAGRGRRAAPDRLRDARRHLPDRLPRHRDGRRAARRPDGHLRRRPGRADGRPLGDHPRGQQGDGRRPAPRPAAAGRVDRRDRHRRLEGRPGARPSSTRRWGWARTTAASASATRRTSPTARSRPT